MKIFRSIRKLFYSFLGFFGLLDEKRELSRTTIILYIFVYKFANVPLATSSINELVGALVALGGVGGAMGLYAWKKKIAANVGTVSDELITAIKATAASSDTEE